MLTMAVESCRLLQRTLCRHSCVTVMIQDPCCPLWRLEKVNPHHKVHLVCLGGQRGLASRWDQVLSTRVRANKVWGMETYVLENCLRKASLLIPRSTAKADMLWVVGGLFRKNLVLDGRDEFTDRETPWVFRNFDLGIATVHHKGPNLGGVYRSNFR